jgi:hypothetical protein
MTKLNTEYFYNKGKELENKWHNGLVAWQKSKEDLNNIYPYYQQKIENSLISFLKLKDLENYQLKYSLKNRFRIYYKKKYLILDLEFIYDKETKNFVDFIVSVPNFKLKSKIILNNFNIIYKITKNLIKKDLLLKKYNFLSKQFITKTNKLIQIQNKKIRKISGKNTLGEKVVNNQYKFAKKFFLKKKLYFQESNNIISLDYYPKEISNPISLIVNPVDSNLYKVIINCKPSKECSQGFYSFEMNMSKLDELLFELACGNMFDFK